MTFESISHFRNETNVPVRIAAKDGAQKVSGRGIRTAEIVGIGLVSVAFVGAVMEPELPLVDPLGTWKWSTFLGFAAFCLLQHRLRIVLSSKHTWLFGIFVAVASFSSIRGAGDYSETAMRLISFWTLWVIAFLCPIPKDPVARVMIWTKILIGISAVITILSLSAYPLPIAIAGGRLKGITSNANTLGSFAMITALAGFHLLQSYKNRRMIFAGLFLLIAGAVAIFLTNSRSSTVALLAGVLVMAIVKIRRSGMSKGTIVLLVGSVLLMGAYLYVQDLRRDSDVFVDRGWDLAAREMIFRSQINAWLDAPFVGQGLDRGQPHFLAAGGGHVTGRPGGESSFFDLLAVAGILGAIPLFWGFAWSGSRLLRETKRLHSHWLSLGVALFVAVAVNSIGEGYLAAVGSILAIYVWMLCGAAAQLAAVRYLSKSRRFP